LTGIGSFPDSGAVSHHGSFNCGLWGKNDISDNIDTIYELTAKPEYVCEICARVAKLKANVCNPHKFEKK
jgi:hypothetical protein